MALVNSSFDNVTVVYASDQYSSSYDRSYVVPNYDFNYPCTQQADCGFHAYCIASLYNDSISFCACRDHYTSYPYGSKASRQEENCAYHLKSQIGASFLSFFFGWMGADWFYLARGNATYIGVGCAKLALCVWNVVIIWLSIANQLNWPNGPPGRLTTLQQWFHGFCWLLVIGGIAWWFTDFIRVATYAMRDGNGWKMGSF